MDIEKRISDLSKAELDRLLSVLNFALSGSEIGEAKAFELVAEIEVMAIKSKAERDSGWIPDEQLAGYIG